MLVQSGWSGELRPWARSALLGCIAAWNAGCALGGVTLHHVLSASPDGYRVLLEKDNELELYDLEAGRRSWRVTVSRPVGWSAAVVEWSKNGSYFVLGEQQYPESLAGRYSIWERDTGRRISPTYSLNGQFVTSNGGLTVSNDGRWFASNRMEKSIQLYDTRSVTPSLEVPVHDLRYLPIAFAPYPEQFSLATQLFELRGEVWQPSTPFPNARSNMWVGQRLALATKSAVRIWDGTSTRDIATRGPVELAANDHLLAIIEAIDVEQAKYDSHLERLTLYDVDRARVRFIREDLGSELQVVFRDERVFVRGFQDTYDTYVLELDPHTGQTLRQQNFRRWGAGNRGSPHVSFYPIVLPQALYVELVDGNDEHKGRFVKLELK